MDAQPLLSLRLSVDYPGKPGVLRELALDVGRQEILGLVGQSGCGKSTLALAILKLLYLKRGEARGSMHFNGRANYRMRYTIIGIARLSPHFTPPDRRVSSTQYNSLIYRQGRQGRQEKRGHKLQKIIRLYSVGFTKFEDKSNCDSDV